MAQAAKTYNDLVDLRLTADEAATLAAIICLVAGSPSTSPRGHKDAIAEALRSVGYDWQTGPGAKVHALISGSPVVYIKDYPTPEPPFEPGYFKDTGDGEVSWFEDPPRGAPADGKWVRVNVTLADG